MAPSGGNKRTTNQNAPFQISTNQNEPPKLLCLQKDTHTTNMIEFLNKNGIINPSQHGFLEGKSSLTNHLETFEDWTTTLNEGYGLDVIYLDYKKAFDTVPHCRLLKKLEANDIQGKLARWVEAFLSARTQRVVLNVSKSEWAPILSGVPQWSVLGPLSSYSM